MPLSITSDEILASSKVFHLTIREILAVQANLIKARSDETERARLSASKITYINSILRDLKYRLYRNNSGEQRSRLLWRIARYEAAKTRKIRDMESPDKNLFTVFAPLFENIVRAKRHLAESKKKLKMVIMYKMNTRGRRL